ncbi:unnamed protein product, partial [Discosporangium mesarthrocarpum]
EKYLQQWIQHGNYISALGVGESILPKIIDNVQLSSIFSESGNAADQGVEGTSTGCGACVFDRQGYSRLDQGCVFVWRLLRLTGPHENEKVKHGATKETVTEVSRGPYMVMGGRIV